MNVGVICRIAVYKAIYPTVGVLADVIAAIDQVSLASYLISKCEIVSYRRIVNKTKII